MAVRIGRLTDSPLQARRLADCPMWVCASPGYLSRHGVPRRVSDLSQHKFAWVIACQTCWAVGDGPAGEFRVPVQGNLVANNGAAPVAAAVGDQGLNKHQIPMLSGRGGAQRKKR
ncbi:LysR substrate-binding domain-containing protein [Stutzerimonas xanthomarina]|uniref:LysR substrate-binding domain-containing protein n=1 Tax=Stutzerimonas xanthomarina TaxID=271420 RepID=UPI003AA89B6D